MRDLLIKDLRLATSPMTWIFLAAALFALVPGYPILMSAFFVCLGIFYSFQTARESNDIIYSVLLPVRKRDIAASKYLFVCVFQIAGFVLMAVLTAVRMTALSASAVYANNVMMNATPVYPAFVLLVYTAFNIFFLGGFFKNAHSLGVPFLMFAIAAFVVIAIGEALHHIPRLGFLNTPAGERLGLQFAILAVAAAVYVLGTYLACRRSESDLEALDL